MRRRSSSCSRATITSARAISNSPELCGRTSSARSHGSTSTATRIAGHALFTGIAEDRYAQRTAELLVSPAFCGGWGMRTIARGERRYNPMSYHNGSVWPHDNGIVAMGFARYGFKDYALKLLL